MASGPGAGEGVFGLERVKCPTPQCEAVTAWLERANLLVQGFGPGTAWQLVSTRTQAGCQVSNPLTGTTSTLLVDLYEQQDDLTMSLVPKRDTSDALKTLQQALAQWNAANPSIPVFVGPKLLQSSLNSSLLPQGAFVACGTKKQGLLYQVASPSWSPDRPVCVRSISKCLAGLVALRLQQQGKLSLDEPVGSYLQSWDRPDKATITLRHLLNHTAGHEDPSIRHPAVAQHNISLYESAAMVAELPVVAPPGKIFRYTATGSQVLGAVVEKVTGKSWNQAFKELVAVPLGMHNTWYGDRANSGQDPSNPAIGINCISTTEDLLQLLAMVVYKGLTAGADSVLINPACSTNSSSSFLTADSFEELLKNQAAGADFSGCPVGADDMAPETAAHVLLNGLQEAGLITPELCEDAKGEVEGVGYAFGTWPSHVKGDASCRNFHSVGQYNTFVRVTGVDAENPFWFLMVGGGYFNYLWQVPLAALSKAFNAGSHHPGAAAP